jgi:hypothetical protein
MAGNRIKYIPNNSRPNRSLPIFYQPVEASSPPPEGGGGDLRGPSLTNLKILRQATHKIGKK